VNRGRPRPSKTNAERAARVNEILESLLDELAVDIRDPKRRRELFLLLGAAYALIRADDYGYKAADTDRFNAPEEQEREFRAVQAATADGGLFSGADEWTRSTDAQLVRKWIAGFFFGSAAERLYAASASVKSGVPIGPGTPHDRVGAYVRWFKHDERDLPRPGPDVMPELSHGVELLREIVAARRARTSRRGSERTVRIRR
jgi:hypothetical protein